MSADQTFAPDDPPAIQKADGRRRADDWRDKNKGAGRTTLVVVTLLLLLAVAGLIVGLFTWTGEEPEPYLVTVPVGEYPPPWPTNPYAERDAKELADCFRSRDGSPAAAEMYNFQERDKLRTVLDWVAGRGQRPDAKGQDDLSKRPLVFHLSALAVARGGKVYVLPGDASPDDLVADPPTTWVPIDEVLDALAANKADRRFLLLDVARPVADPFGGLLRDDAATTLDALLKARQDAGNLPYPVLTSCGPGELPVSADPEQRSAFALYLSDGLRGAADGYAGLSRDEKVTVRELAAFVAARVSRYARSTRNARQTPQFYAPPGDFPLTGKPLPAREPGPARAYPAAAKAGWQDRAAAIGRGARQDSPHHLARLTDGLLRADDEWWRSGRDDRADKTRQAAAGAWDRATRGSSAGGPSADIYTRAADDAGAFRLAVAHRGTKPDAVAPLKALFEAYAAAAVKATGKPDDPGAKAKADAEMAWAEKAKADPPAAAWAVWLHAEGTPAPSRAYLAACGKAVELAGLQRQYAETLLLRLLGQRDFVDKQDLPKHPSEAIGALIRAEHQLGQALAAGPDGFELVEGKLNEAEADRAAGQAALFAAKSQAEVDAAAARLKKAEAGFVEARRAVKDWQDASRKSADVTADVVDTAAASLLYGSPPPDDWRKAAEAAANLADAVAAAKPGAYRADAVKAPVALAVDAAAKARGPVDKPELDRLLKLPAPRTPADADRLRAVTAAAVVGPDDRTAAWNALADDAAKRHESARGADAADDAAKSVTAAPPPPEAGPDPRPADRARASVALLRLSGFPGADDLDRKVGSADLGPALARAWRDELPKRFAAAAEGGRWADADRAARATPPGATAYRKPPDPPHRPAAELAAKAAAAYRKWSVTPLRADRAVRGRLLNEDDFYSDAETRAQP